ncbi:hypothetical protein GCM10010149_04510 [Nonomuraea roseoviolacea subsp. roseoviolacea]|uniref:Htaa domain-containing protein n=1 Tax=Nonomuraea roseoviolacea subsp. carminata TaxID=160689 RepID=A0ABT1K529_9ACTN|nr:hypothetical protein [Nonomuraea roseoviolacea]MCP2349112.1 hypothetical protein [Nonomuraea roseoviolacea subsp. carminata]
MSARLGMRSFSLLTAAVLGALTLGAGTAAHADADTDQKVLLKGSTTASYFWDDSSGRAGDTGLPASGKPMQKGLVASPSWPLMTEGYVVYKGKKAPFFVGDRGPGVPSSSGVMLDLDAKTFAQLTGGRFNSETLGVDGVGGQGHIKVSYVITKWGSGPGKKNVPVSFASGAWRRVDRNPAKPPLLAEDKATAPKEAGAGSTGEVTSVSERDKGNDDAGVVTASERTSGRSTAEAGDAASGDQGLSASAALALTGVAAVGGGAYLGRDRLRKLLVKS